MVYKTGLLTTVSQIIATVHKSTRADGDTEYILSLSPLKDLVL